MHHRLLSEGFTMTSKVSYSIHLLFNFLQTIGRRNLGSNQLRLQREILRLNQRTKKRSPKFLLVKNLKKMRVILTKKGLSHKSEVVGAN